MTDAEILAPVGGPEQLLAAVRCGADAVYLGARGFNARRNAENFEETGLSDAVSLAHRHGVRVHVTVNTLVMDGEYPALEKTAEEIAAAGADAVIVQDPAVMRLFLSRYPTLPVHASTQCAVHNADGVHFFEDLGVSRVVLARELSIREIEAIRRQTTVELEAFVHGALCMCLSGACYLSSLLGGRSGNRGLCAQPCRLDFRAGGASYALSLKDMSHLRHIRALREAGVCSFKIEGRMKRPEYVAAAVTAARAALAGQSYDEETLRAVFSRAGFTDGYALGKRDGSMFGHRGKEDVTAAEGVLASLRRLYDKETPRVPVTMALSVGPDRSEVRAEALGTEVAVSGAGGIVAQSRPTDRAFAEKSLSKTGGTPYMLTDLTVENPAGLMLPPSVMNGLRRDALAALDARLGAPRPHRAEPYALPHSPRHVPGPGEIWARFERAEQVVTQGVDRVILPLAELSAHPELLERLGGRLTGEVPPVFFPENEEETRALAQSLAGRGLGSLWAENAGAVTLARGLGLPVYGGAGLNILSTPALDFWEKQGLAAATVSFELRMEKLAALGGALPRGYLVYGYLPAMRVRACPARAASGCAGCDGRPHLGDRKGADFQIICHQKRFQTILNSVPLHLGGKPQAKADFRLLSFTLESRDECARILREIQNDEPARGPRTGGLYYRELK